VLNALKTSQILAYSVVAEHLLFSWAKSCLLNPYISFIFLYERLECLSPWNSIFGIFSWFVFCVSVEKRKRWLWVILKGQAACWKAKGGNINSKKNVVRDLVLMCEHISDNETLPQSNHIRFDSRIYIYCSKRKCTR